MGRMAGKVVRDLTSTTCAYLHRFIQAGGYKLLNTWLTSSKAANNVPLLQQILLTLQHLPLTVDHLKQVSRE